MPQTVSLLLMLAAMWLLPSVRAPCGLARLVRGRRNRSRRRVERAIRVRGELRGDPWLRLHRPLEEIHGDVHAAGLLVIAARFISGLPHGAYFGVAMLVAEQNNILARHAQRVLVLTSGRIDSAA